MSDNKTQELVNYIRNKEKLTIRFVQPTDKNGYIILNINPPFKPKYPEATYTISLISLTTTSLVPNLNSTNNKFVYSINNTEQRRIITFLDGFYLGEAYNNQIKHTLKSRSQDEKSITLTLNEATGRTHIVLANGYKVYFTEGQTWRDRLGFNSKDLTTDGEHISDRICDLTPALDVFVHCSACTGNKLVTAEYTEASDVLFSFPCNHHHGEPITYQLDPRLTESELDLSTGQLSKIVMRFTDEKDDPITFSGSKISVSLHIRQV